MLPQVLRDLLTARDRGLVLVDVRQDDFKGGHIRGSQHIPIDSYVLHDAEVPEGVHP